jgi:H+/Cl- antiporter ClcA/predicted transcriptional regulator
MAVPIGLVSAFVAQFLLWLISLITNICFLHRFSAAPALPQENHLGWWIVLVPVVGAIIIGLMARYGSDKIRGHGIPEALEAILLGRSFMDIKVAILKPLSSAISIGTGGPFGAEGPIIMTGGAFGSIFAQFFKMTAAERKTLLAAGAAAGMSAVFATPIAAILLAVELLLFEWKPRSFVPVALASVVASRMRVPLLGTGPIFPMAPHPFLGSQMLFIALIVGLAAGFGSCLVTAAVYYFEDLFSKLPVHWMWWPAIGAVFVGICGYFEPRVLGVGYDTIHHLINGEMLGKALIALLILKALVWAVALGSGTSGGVLAPLLIIGGGIGALTSQGLSASDAGLWALVGMAAMMGGTMQAPLTGMVFALELSGDLNALPALAVGGLTALTITILVLKRSILTEKLARRGQHIAREYSVDPFELMRVGEAMETNAPTVPAEMPLNELSDRIAAGDPAVCSRQAVLVVSKTGELEGIITRGDIMRHLQTTRRGDIRAMDAGHKDLVLAYPDEPLHVAVAKMLKHDIGRLPVVDRANHRRIVGYLGRADILAARLRAHEEEEVREKGPVMKNILKVPQITR